MSAAATVASRDARVPADAAIAPRGRVVIVDDHADMQSYLTHVLAAEGFEVDVLPNGAAALAACQARPPDAVVSDVVMPGLDGFKLIERLRADERTAMTPVLLLSGHASEESRIAGLKAGADDYLIKPVRRRELVARVEGAIRLARMRQENSRREQADLESLFSLGPDGVIVVGQSGGILTANERARELFGYSLQDLLALRFADLMTQDHGGAHGARSDHVWRPVTRLVTPIQEFRAVRRDGSEFVAEVVLGPLQQFRNEACTIAIVRDITERKKLESERAAQEKRFRELSRHLVEVQEAERRMLSTELHDRTSPNLAAIRINLRLLSDLLSARGTDDVRALLDDTAALIGETTITIREISSNLRPTVLDDGGLLPAVAGYAQQFMKRTGIAVHVEGKGPESSLTPAVRSSVFRIVQEALTNCAKHARARQVTIRLSTDDRNVSLFIADDGVGFDLGAERT
ncbi:MAG TPA: response regulator, partial [Burkholderiales bacterium]|nr:response regulator [Burkholderiales bacterium]